MKILFVCSQNKLRSPTAELIFSEYNGIETMSAGTDTRSVNPLSSELIEWADIVIVMENYHRNKVYKKFKQYFKNKRLIVLNIPDEFEYMEPALINILKTRVNRYIHFT